MQNEAVIDHLQEAIAHWEARYKEARHHMVSLERDYDRCRDDAYFHGAEAEQSTLDDIGRQMDDAEKQTGRYYDLVRAGKKILDALTNAAEGAFSTIEGFLEGRY